MARHDLAAAKRLNQVDDNADTGPDSGSTPVRSPLRTVMSACAVEHGLSAKDLTVLAPQNDPFRLETPARHRDGEWLAMTARELGLGDRKIHLRGLHYMVIGKPKPDGTPYTNTDSDWLWLSGDAGKAARWLGYLPFDQITDQRNAAPVVRIFERPDPWPYITVGLEVDVPDADDLVPRVDVADFHGVQPYKLVLFGEKSSLDAVLAPIAESYKADLYLPTGEISDTLMHQMVRIAAADGRPMVVFCFSDADPSGWQMPVSIGRKLQGFKAGLFPGIDFEVYRVALTPDQVRHYELPSTALKATELRADRWRSAMLVDQTEIDALASLRPELLDSIARQALDPFYDRGLDLRVYQARGRWLDEAQAAVDAQIDTDLIDELRTVAAEKLQAMRAEIDAINNELQIDTDGFDLPTPVVPAADLTGPTHPLPLLDSRWPFLDQCQALIDSKAYRSTIAGVA